MPESRQMCVLYHKDFLPSRSGVHGQHCLFSVVAPLPVMDYDGVSPRHRGGLLHL